MSFVRQILTLLTALSLGGGLIFYGTFGNAVSRREKNISVSPRSLKIRSPVVRSLLAYNRDEESEDVVVRINKLKKSMLESNIKAEEPQKTVRRTSTRRSRILKRHKRRVPNKKHFQWQFDVNLTRFDDNSTELPLANDTQTLNPHPENSNKHLGVVVHVEGHGPEESYNELNHAWKSVDGFLKQLFGGNVEELSEQGHGVVINLQGLPSDPQTDKPPTKKPPDEKDEKSQLPKDKEGKFLFGFFGIGGNNENPPKDVGSGKNSTVPNSTLATKIVNDNRPTIASSTEASFVESLTIDKIVATQLPPIESNSSETQHSKTDPIELDSSQTENIKDTSSTTPATDILSTKLPTLPTIDILSRGLVTPPNIGILSTELIDTINPNINTDVEGTSQKSLIDNTFTDMGRRAEVETSKILEVEDFVYNQSTSRVMATSTMQSTTLTSISYVHLPPYSAVIENVSDSSTETRLNIGENIIKSSSESNTKTPEKILTDIRDFCTDLFSRTHRNPSLMIEFSDDEGRGVIVLEENSTNSVETKSQALAKSNNQIPQNSGFIATVKRITDGSFVESNSNKVTSTNEALDALSVQNSMDAKLFNLFPNFGSGRSGNLDEFDVEPEDFNSNALQNRSDLLSVSDCISFFNDINMETTSFSSTTLGINDQVKTKTFEESIRSGIVNLDNELTTVTPLGEGGKFFNIFAFGSGSSEISAVDNRNEFTTNKTHDSRFVSGLWNFGSGERSISESLTDSTTPDIVTDSGRRSIGWIFGLSDERRLDAIESTTEQMVGGNFGFEDAVTGKFSSLNSISETPSEGNLTDQRIEKFETNTPQEESRFFPNIFDFGSGDINFSTESQDDRFVGLGSGVDRNLPETFESTTENKQLKSIGSLFLTGSGDGSPINLIHEHLAPSITSSKPILKRGKLLDDLPTEWYEEKDLSRRRGRMEASMEDFPESSVEHVNTMSPEFYGLHETFDSGKRRGRIEASMENYPESSVRLVTALNPALQEFDGSIEANQETTRPVNDLISPPTFQMNQSFPETEPPTEANVTNTSENQKMAESSETVCSKDSECEKSLNEYCILNGDVAVCDCGKSFVRHPETGKCETPILVETSMKLPGEEFHPDLKDESSELFHKMRKEAIATILDLLRHDPKLLANIAKVEVTGFEEGSLIVHYNIVFAAQDNETVSELVEQVDTEIKDALKDEDLLTKVPFNVTNAKLSTSTGNQCEKSDLNYCSKDADCFQDEIRGFRCQCKEGYLDNSRDKVHAGEICIENCPKSYCSGNGFCELNEDGEKHCICNNWYFGSKCEVSGVVVIGGFSVFNILVVFFVVGIVCFCKKRRSYRSENYGEESQPNDVFVNVSPAANSARITDAVALDVIGPHAEKYMAVSTPMVPAIQVTSPSFMGSVISYDFDSTFDRTSDTSDPNQTVKL